MNYYCLNNAKIKSVGVPIFLDAKLHEKFYAKGADMGMDYEWVCRSTTIPSQGSPFSFPDKLWLIAKERRIYFDLHIKYSGLLASERFLSLLTESELDNFKISKIHAVNKKNENIADHPMFYMKFRGAINVVDRDKSQFIQSKMAGALLTDANGLPSIGYAKSLYFNEEIIARRRIFLASELSINDTFVNEDLYHIMVDKKIKGVDYFTLEMYHKAEEFKRKDLENAYGMKLEQIEYFGRGHS